MNSLFFGRDLMNLFSFQRELERFSGRNIFGTSTFSSGIAPAVNLFEQKDDLVLTAELPGVNPKDVKIELNNGILTLSGEKKDDSPEGVSYHRSERGSGTFSRSIQLPYKVNPEKASADFKDGILVVKISKADEVKPRQIEIR